MQSSNAMRAMAGGVCLFCQVFASGYLSALHIEATSGKCWLYVLKEVFRDRHTPADGTSLAPLV